MDGDILATVRPIDHEFRKQLKTDIDLLAKLCLLWIDTTHSILSPIELYLEHWDDTQGSPPDPVIHPSFVELSHLLMFYADTSPFNIDATPIGDFIDAIRALQDTDWFTRDPNAFVHCDTAERRARRVLNRMCYAAFDAAGKDNPVQLTEPKRRRGRPPGVKSKNTKRSRVERALLSGGFPEAVRRQYGISKRYMNTIVNSLESESSPNKRRRAR